MICYKSQNGQDHSGLQCRLSDPNPALSTHSVLLDINVVGTYLGDVFYSILVEDSHSKCSNF